MTKPKYKISLPTPTQAQQKILSKASRFNAVCMGEQAGKTTLGIEVLIASKNGALSGKAPVAWFAPTLDDAEDAKRRVRRAIDPFIKKQLNAKRIELHNGNYIDFHVLDDTAQVFTQYGLIVVDDARKIPNFLSSFEDMLSECLRENEGEGWFLSGAFGKRNDFYKIYQRGLSDPDWSCWQFPSDCNPHLSDETKEAMSSATEPEFRQRFLAEFLDVAIELTSAQRVIGKDETFRQWCERLATEGLKVDGRAFELDDRPAMAWIYDQVPSTADEAFRLVLVLMKCAQVGFTVMEMLAVIYLGLKFQPSTVGMFLPSQGLASMKSSERFMPIVRTVPEVHKLMTMDAKDGTGKKTGEGNVNTRRIGDALYVFSWTTGKATTESIPMDVLSFDEVQEMSLEQMEKTRERLSASPIRFTLMGSTANWPDSDIHHWYKKGSRHRFHTKCPHCNASKPFDDYFPQCIRWDEKTERHRYVCDTCAGWIDDSQIGDWIPEDPSADPPINYDIPKKDWPLRIRSIHFPQFLSPTISAGEIIDAYNTATDMKNFFNRKLGKPYLDPSQVPVTLEHMANCVKHGLAAGLRWKTRAQNTYMGIDQMGNFNVHVIKERLPDGRQAVIHLEETYSADPFMRSSELMEQYGVAVCVVEINPNYNDAKKFAQRHPGKVFICNSFGSIKDAMIEWADTRLDKSERKTDEEARDRYTVRMDQFKCMQTSMSRFTSDPPTCLFPEPQELVQEVLDKGIRQMAAVAPRCFYHFTKTALVSERDEETNQYTRKVKKIAIDPHFSYANALCDVAWARSHGTTTFIIPNETRVERGSILPGEIQAHNPVAQVIEQLEVARGNTCGACLNCGDNSFCDVVLARVKPADPGCWAYIAKG